MEVKSICRRRMTATTDSNEELQLQEFIDTDDYEVATSFVDGVKIIIVGDKESGEVFHFESYPSIEDAIKDYNIPSITDVIKYKLTHRIICDSVLYFSKSNTIYLTNFGILYSKPEEDFIVFRKIKNTDSINDLKGVWVDCINNEFMLYNSVFKNGLFYNKEIDADAYNAGQIIDISSTYINISAKPIKLTNIPRKLSPADDQLFRFIVHKKAVAIITKDKPYAGRVLQNDDEGILIESVDKSILLVIKYGSGAYLRSTIKIIQYNDSLSRVRDYAVVDSIGKLTMLTKYMKELELKVRV